MPWFELQLNLPEIFRDPVTNRLFELGAQGVNEEKDSIKAFFEVASPTAFETEIRLYLKSLAEMNPHVAAVTLAIQEVKDENWGERYKEFYHAQKLSRTFFLKPAWEAETPVPEEMIPILMEPGQAFGTGLHASTKLCMSGMEQWMKYYARPAKVRVLDVGTGTGILAIAARKLGLGHITAVDNDPVAVETAKENIVLNQCSDIKVSGADIATLKGPFDLILSNILLETHRELAKEYKRLLIPGGQLVVAGLLGYQRKEINAILAESGFIVEYTIYLQEWMAVVSTAR